MSEFRMLRGLNVTLVGVAVAVLIFALNAVSFERGPYSLFDDAFITFRYSRNLAEGLGPVFNPGQRVEGYTNFLWMLAMAAGMRLGLDPVLVSKALAGLSGAGMLLLTAALSKQILPDAPAAWHALPSLLLAILASIGRYAVSGFETLTFTLLMGLGVWLHFAAGPEFTWRRAASALVSGLAALTRPEGLLFFGLMTLFFAATLFRGRRGYRGLLAWVGVFGSLVLPFFIWRFNYYGHWLPNTFYAKVGGLTPVVVGRGLGYLRDFLLIVNFPLAVCLAASLPIGLRCERTRLLLALTLGNLLYLVVIGGDDGAIFGPRLLMPVFPLIAVLGLSGLWRILRGRPRGWAFIVVTALFAAGIGLSVFEGRAYRHVRDSMMQGWIVLADWMLGEGVPPDSLVAVDAAGIIPYYTRLPTLDMLGLTDEHIARKSVPAMGGGLAGHEKYDPAYVLLSRPRYIASWLDEDGRPVSAGLSAFSTEVLSAYRLRAVSLMRLPEPGESVVLNGEDFTAQAHEMGYIYGLLVRVVP